ncbi:MAG: glutamine amidotransferase [Myxococcaceae bacterium]
MNAADSTAWKLVSLSPLPSWALVALAVAVALGVLLAAVGLRQEASLWRRLALLGLRTVAAVAALFLLLEPGVRTLQVARVKNRVAVLVDRSASMGLPVGPGGGSRSAAVAEALERIAPGLKGLEERFTVELLGFEPALVPVSEEILRTAPALGTRTDLLGALRALRATDTGGSRKLSGVLLFSDGADNTELQGGISPHARAELTALGFPVSTVQVGDPSLLDVALENLKVDDFAFVRNAVAVEVELRVRGLPGRDVPVVLEREGQVLGTKTVHVNGADETIPVSFSFTPDQTGRFVYTLSAPVFPGEAVTENNTRSFVLKVIRDRVRVLLVVGRPSWDERFLRALLRQDANVDLVSFYILRTSSDDTQTRNPERELSLIPFPMEEIFDAKLSTFDVVIFQNFGHSDPQLSIAQYERKLEQYVSNGGALVAIGGDRAFGDSRASYPILDRALPVDSVGQAASVAPYRVHLTAEGQRHPVTSVLSTAAASVAAWDELPAGSGVNLVRAKPGATVLLDHPGLLVDAKPAPVLALWEHGRGRAMALMTDDSWTWAFTVHRNGDPSRLYDRFWGNALRWLVRDPDLTTLQVTADPPSVEPGTPVGAVVTAREADYQPAVGAEVTVELSSVRDRRVVGNLRATTGADGTARVSFPPQPVGAYRLHAQAMSGERLLGEGQDAVAVRTLGLELTDATVRADLLAGLARDTGGRVYRLPLQALPDFPLLDPPVVEVGRSRDRPVWDRWEWLLLLATALGLEWVLRRRFGYI